MKVDPRIAELVARKIKIHKLSNSDMPGMDEFAIKLNSQPTYHEIQEAILYIKAINVVIEEKY